MGYKVKKIYVGDKLVRPKWKPGANTVAYYKFDGNLNDSSGNNRNLSLAAGSVTYGTESGGAKYGYFDTSTYTNNYTSMSYNTSAYTINIWYKRVGSNSGTHCTVADFHTGGNYFPRFNVFTSEVGYIVSRSNVSTSNTDTWSNYCISISGNTATCYRNGTQVGQFSVNSFNSNLPYFRLNTVGYTTSSYSNYTSDGRMSALIIENKARNAQEIADYYNQTKADYEPTPRNPGANTIAYYPLTANFNDESGNSRNLTNSGGTITTLNGVNCAYYNGSSYSMYNNYSLSNTARTASCWVCKSNNARVALNISNYNTNQGGSLGILFYSNYIMVADDYGAQAMAETCSAGIWYNVVATQEGSTVKAYLNGEYIGESTTRPSQTPTGWSLGALHNTSHGDKYIGYISNAILENKVRTAQDISDYYNSTKGNYGL